MLSDAITYLVRNMLSARRTDNVVVHVETDDDCYGKPIYSMERSTELGEELLQELSVSSCYRRTSSLKLAAELTQSFVQQHPGLLSIRVQLGNDVVQSTGA